MERRDFLAKALLGTITMMNLETFARKMEAFSPADSMMPVLFVGHGNPMNAIEKNEYHRKWQEVGKSLPRPKAILVVSAHWETEGTMVTAMEKPRTIHDFYGFPQALFDQQYNAPGSPGLAKETQQIVKKTKIQLDQSWGLDHGAWSILLPMFPKADIPVFQLSIDRTKPPQWHYDLAKELKALRKRGVLIVGSGNIVHNLRVMRWVGQPYDWALEFDALAKQKIEKADHLALIDYQKLGTIAKNAIPTNEHYLPLLYTLGVRDAKDDLTFFNEKIDLGSVSMRSVILS